jgi:hypothetical protein
LWRPDDHRRNLRRRAPRALAIADPDQDRHLMTIVALPAAQRRSSSSPTTRRSTNPMSSRPPQTLSSRRAHTRRSHPRPRKSAPCSLLTITSAAFHPRHHMGDPSATPKSRPAKPRLFLPAVSSLRGFRTPAPRPVPASPAKRRRPKPFSQADIADPWGALDEWAARGGGGRLSTRNLAERLHVPRKV